MRRHQLSRIKRANLPYIAEEVEFIMHEAPGARTPQRVRKPRQPRRNLKLEMADANITRCNWCGVQVWKANHCRTCRTKGYPTIDDLGEAV